MKLKNMGRCKVSVGHQRDLIKGGFSEPRKITSYLNYRFYTYDPYE